LVELLVLCVWITGEVAAVLSSARKVVTRFTC
jgi:hypothetical protein